MVVYQHAAAPIAGVFFGGAGDFDFTVGVHSSHTDSTRHPSAARAVALEDHHGIVLRRETNLAAVAASLMFYHDSFFSEINNMNKYNPHRSFMNSLSEFVFFGKKYSR